VGLELSVYKLKRESKLSFSIPLQFAFQPIPFSNHTPSTGFESIAILGYLFQRKK
jgi:hypothetical protein